MEHYFAFGKDGVIEKGLHRIGDVNFGKKHIQFSPAKMLPNENFSISFNYPENPSHNSDLTDRLWQDIQSVYSKWGNFGKFGDVLLFVKYLRNDYYFYEVVMIGWLEFPKPVYAVDVLPFVATGHDTMYFVGGIKIDRLTGERIKVLCGGKRDVNGFYYESPFETAIREAEEELGIKIAHTGLSSNISLRDLSLEEFNAEVSSVNSEILCSGPLEKLRDFWTSDEENHLATNTKRVHLTTVFRLLLVNSDDERNCTLAELKKFFQAGDDLCEIFFWDINDGTPDFALPHHAEIYEAAVKNIYIEGRM